LQQPPLFCTLQFEENPGGKGRNQKSEEDAAPFGGEPVFWHPAPYAGFSFGVRIWAFFRISCFGLRILVPPACVTFLQQPGRNEPKPGKNNHNIFYQSNLELCFSCLKTADACPLR
jgi:hypothetical protein